MYNNVSVIVINKKRKKKDRIRRVNSQLLNIASVRETDKKRMRGWGGEQTKRQRQTDKETER